MEKVGAKRRQHGSAARRWGSALGVGISLLGLACGAVYPEMKTAVRAPVAHVPADPPPSDDLYYFYFEKAWVPAKNQGGQQWPGGAPDPFAKLIIDDKEVVVTPVQSRTRTPTWPDQKKENLRIHSNSKIFVELWDSNPMTNQPICRARLRDIEVVREGGNNEIWCDSGARVFVHVEAGKHLVGVGLYYETRGQDGVRVTRVVADSPAARAGLGAGDRILAIQGKKVSKMDALEIRSAINQHSRSGVELDVWFKNGKRHVIQLKEGALYPLRGDDLQLPE